MQKWLWAFWPSPLFLKTFKQTGNALCKFVSGSKVAVLFIWTEAQFAYEGKTLKQQAQVPFKITSFR